jgi:FtsP/CotA-like multicopper oxidase with cupredoxin domain
MTDASPGPTIEAERGRPVRVEWINELEGTLPVIDTLAPTNAGADGVPVQCVSGLSGGAPHADVASLDGFTVVHLHGGLTAAPYDGWAENIFAPGQHAVADYSIEQRTALLWYHDHVMGVTRFTVYAGLARLWILRDERERALDPFQVLARHPVMVDVPRGGITDTETVATVRHARGPHDQLEDALDANELGLKDTVRVNPNEIVELAVRFETYSGRHMYHCHILEHEDRDMMHPFVIMPMQLKPFTS